MPVKEDAPFRLWIVPIGLLGLLIALGFAAAGAAPLKAGVAASLPVGGTPTPTPTVCTQSYTYTLSARSIVSGTSLLPGSQCGACAVPVTLPFPFTFYGQTYTSTNVIPQGNVQFVTTDTSNNTCPPPYPQLGPAILPAWDTILDTGQYQICQSIVGRPCGVYTSVSGTAPNRIFIIEWVARRQGSSTYIYNFELRLYESGGVFDFVYGRLVPPPSGYNSSVGVQNGAGQFTYYACNAANSIYMGLMIRWNPTCPLPDTPTNTPIATRTFTNTPIATPTFTNTPTATLTPTPTPTQGPSLCEWAWRVDSGAGGGNGIAATSPEDAWTVGSGVRGAMTRHWDGSTWTDVFMAMTYTAEIAELRGVSAAAPDNVWAAGYAYGRWVHLPLVGHWDGHSWAPGIFGTKGDDGYLNAIASAGNGDVWTVGYYNFAGTNYPTMWSWRQDFWSIVPSPPVAGALQSVAVVAPDDVWAVGYTITGTVTGTLVEHWDGSAVTIVPSPNIGSASRLNGVAAVSASDVWAVGSYYNGSVTRTLIEHWDGSAWSIVPSPNYGSSDNALNGVAAVSANDVWAVGYGGDRADDPRPLPMHWDGSVWTISQVVGSPGGLFKGITVAPRPSSTPELWAAGSLVARYSLGCVFSDVSPSDYFYQAVGYLYYHGVISGYADGTFKPYNLTTRGQLTKIVSLAEGWTIYTPPAPTFRDVPTTDPFYQFIETAYSHGIISGYDCGPGCLEFRPGNNVTRAQLCKIVALAEGWPTYTPPTPTFVDVPTDHAFYEYIETSYHQGIISGYNCGDNCLEFRPGNNATRGQIAKIVYLAVTAP